MLAHKLVKIDSDLASIHFLRQNDISVVQYHGETRKDQKRFAVSQSGGRGKQSRSRMLAEIGIGGIEGIQVGIFKQVVLVFAFWLAMVGGQSLLRISIRKTEKKKFWLVVTG